MAMTILNNTSSMMTLGELNKNITKVGKDLKKVSSGQKINSAGDAAAEYSISEKMRVQIRSLDQDVDNVKNGRALLKVAAGGIDNIVDELRNLKELALNSANDTNTDEDRATMQKEFDQKMTNIDDIASTTNYNGRLLLNGDYYSPIKYWGTTYTKGSPQTTTLVVGHKLEKIQIGSKTSPVTHAIRDTVPNNTIQGFASAFTVSNDVTEDLSTTRVSRQPSRWYQEQYSSLKDCSKIFSRNPNLYNENFSTWHKSYATFDEQIAVKIDFSGISKVGGGTINIPSDLDNQGFSILCGACSEQYINIRFDASTDNSQYQHENPNHEGPMTYTIGIQSVTTIDELEDALFNGIKNAPGKPTNTANWQGNSSWAKDTPSDTSDSVIMDIQHNFRIAKDPSGNGYVFLKGTPYSPMMGIYDKGTLQDVYVTEDVEVPIYEEREVEVTQDITTYPLVQTEDWLYEPGRPLVIHHGTKANQALNVYINDMHTDAMGLSYTNVANQDDAIWALSDDRTGRVGAIDAAIEYALNEATTIGSYISRLEFTEENLVTASENVQASESTIRDADMAKEMTEYTKSNVLAQASQSMLAQANQNSSSVLSLLQ